MKTPYPTLPELLREAGKILESTPSNRYLDEMINKNDCDFEQFKSNHKEIFSAWKRGDAPESEILDRKVRDFGDLLLREYIAFIKEPSVAGFDRGQTIPMLLEVFLAPRLIEFLKPWTQERLGIEVGQLLSHDHPVAFAFEWLEHMYPKAWKDYEESRYKAYAGRDDNLANWKNGDHVPKYVNLLALLDEFIDGAGIEEDEALLVRELFCGTRSLAELFRVTEPYSFHSVVRNRLFNSERTIDPVERLQAHYSGNLHSVMRQVEPLYRLNGEICQQLFFSEERSQKVAQDIDAQLIKAESLCLQLKDVNAMWWRTARLRAAWFVGSGRIEEARKEYRRLFDFIFYVGMEDLDRVYHEALVVAAACKDRVFLRELKNVGILFGRFSDPVFAENSKASKKHNSPEVEDWEVVQWANMFQHYFPSEFFFDGVKPISSGTKLKCGTLLLGPKEWSLKIKDWRPPASQLKNVGGKRITALMYFATLGKVDEVRELISMGADVNILSSSNDSALIMAIDRASPMVMGPTNTSCFEAISALNHDKSVLNTSTDKLKLTVLGCAVNTGNPSIVKRVIEMGADPHQHFEIDQISPLFKAVYNFQDVPGLEDFLNALESGSPELLESIRRHNPAMAGVDLASVQKRFEHLGENPRHREIGKEFSEYLKQQHTSIGDGERCQVVRVLLESGANPNEAHHVNGKKGYTPLMLAIELRRADVLAAMLDKNNPVQVELSHEATLPNGYRINARELALKYQFQTGLDLINGFEG